MYIIVSKTAKTHEYVNPLGHEIHITRFILYDLLQKNKISTNDIIVTNSIDRFFLYNKIFNNVITYTNYVDTVCINEITTDNIQIDLTFYSPVCTQNIKLHIFNILDYDFKYFDSTTPLFLEHINNINYYDLNSDTQYKDIINNHYIVIHQRFNYDHDKINKIIEKIKLITNYKIIIFSMNNTCNYSYCNANNITIINNLQIYASLLNNNNCKLFISEWSGGGQLSQYCYNGLILYYFDNYASHDYEIHYDNYQKGANQNYNIFNCWDFKTTTNCKRKYYKTLELLLNNLDNQLFLSNP
jgi:hypothetical protein